MPETAAEISEYNPYHNGHLINLEKIRNIKREETTNFAIMNPSTVKRAKHAI